jgi:hypothetical protein
MGTTLQRLLVRSLGAMVCVLAVLAGCISFVFRVNALSVAKILVRSRCYHGKPQMSHLLLTGRSNGFQK